MDTLTTQERSRVMAAIRGKDTTPEVFVRKLLFSQGYRYRNNSGKLPGHPDIWLKKHGTAIFIHGCFWHRHEGCRLASSPKSRVDFWQEKFARNQKRDAQVLSSLKDQGVRCLIIWECTVRKMMKDEEFRDEKLREIIHFLEGTETQGQM